MIMTRVLAWAGCVFVNGIFGASMVLSQTANAPKEGTTKTTYTYKTVGNCAIKADVYRAAGATIRPVVIWIHGGALIMGNREQIDKALLGKLVKAGYVIVSIDYRLAPETKLAAILEDLTDAGCDRTATAG